ncbi:ATP-binding protein [Streptomyces chartreusis]
MTQMVRATLAFLPVVSGATEAFPFPVELESPPQPETAAAAAPPLLPPFARQWPLYPTTVRLARVHARTWLTMSRWPGDQDEALFIVQEVVENGVKHPTHVPADGVVELVLSVAEDGELTIEVTDPDPRFPRFNEVISTGPITGLGRVRALGGEVTWGTPDVERGKTVRVRLRPSKP